MILRLPKLRHHAVLILPFLVHGSTHAAQPSVRQALSVNPMHKDVQYDQPTEEQIDDCAIQPERDGEARAWIVTDASGNLLRRFSDTNGDNQIDQWCYFRGGVEVYRDIDANFNEKTDQYRWFGTGGLRWGLDPNEDGKIDDWKWISAEEVTAELVRAIATRDSARFRALLIRDDELASIGIGSELAAQIAQQTKSAAAEFEKFSQGHEAVHANSEWVGFSAPQPGVVPGNRVDVERDLIVYENVIAMVETDGKHSELPVGTLVRVEDRWRLIGLPQADEAGFFFRVGDRRTLPVARVGAGMDSRTQELVQQLEEIDNQLRQASPDAMGKLYTQRVGVIRDLATAASGEEREMWLLQMIDSYVAAVPSGATGPEIGALKQMSEEVAKLTDDKEVVAQAKFAFLTAEYSDSLQQPKADFAKIQENWIKQLETFATDFEGTRPAAEAMLQLAISEEFAGNDSEAQQWYARIIRDQPSSDMAEKAHGAARRLDSIGKPFVLKGNSLAGSAMDLAQLRGNIVLVHYWATWCGPCKQDMQELKKIAAEYGRKKFAVVGVNLDDQPQDAVNYLKNERLNWPQFHDVGGLDSGLAKQMGVFTLPLMMLVDEQGRIVNRSITIAELEVELEKRLNGRSKR